MVKIGQLKLTEEEAYKMYQEKKYIVTYSKIYQLHYSNVQKKVYGTQIYCKDKDSIGLVKRGRFISLSGKAVNCLLKFALVNE